MSDPIIAALISASASITVAVISKTLGTPSSTRTPAQVFTRTQTRPWWPTLAALGLWLLISPAAIHHDIAGQNFLVIPVVLVLLALWRPRSPLTGAWVTLAAVSANFVLGPLSNRLAGATNDTAFAPDQDKLPLLVAIILGSTLLVALACWIGLRRISPRADQSAPHPTTPPASSTDVVGGLERLAKLRSDGLLSEDEFQAAKKALLHK